MLSPPTLADLKQNTEICQTFQSNLFLYIDRINETVYILIIKQNGVPDIFFNQFSIMTSLCWLGRVFIYLMYSLCIHINTLHMYMNIIYTFLQVKAFFFYFLYSALLMNEF